MAIGERIHFFRLLRGMTQKYLGMALGFPEKSADVMQTPLAPWVLSLAPALGALCSIQ